MRCEITAKMSRKETQRKTFDCARAPVHSNIGVLVAATHRPYPWSFTLFTSGRRFVLNTFSGSDAQTLTE